MELNWETENPERTSPKALYFSSPPSLFVKWAAAVPGQLDGLSRQRLEPRGDEEGSGTAVGSSLLLLLVENDGTWEGRVTPPFQVGAAQLVYQPGFPRTSAGTSQGKPHRSQREETRTQRFRGPSLSLGSCRYSTFHWCWTHGASGHNANPHPGAWACAALPFASARDMPPRTPSPGLSHCLHGQSAQPPPQTRLCGVEGE